MSCNKLLAPTDDACCHYSGENRLIKYETFSLIVAVCSSRMSVFIATLENGYDLLPLVVDAMENFCLTQSPLGLKSKSKSFTIYKTKTKESFQSRCLCILLKQIYVRHLNDFCFSLQWTRSITWHLLHLLPTTCTIPSKH